MTIHHTYTKKAIQMNCHLSEVRERLYRIFWPIHSVELTSASVMDVIIEMEAVQAILNTNPEYKITTNNTCYVTLFDPISKQQMVGAPMLPSIILHKIDAGEDHWMTAIDEKSETKIDPNRIGGVHKNGGIAFKEGVPASDCPYIEGDSDFDRWNDEWDAEADKDTQPEYKPKRTGSVVTNTYRARYTESGHTSDCGDSLATLLNNVCRNKKGTNIQLFEAICLANGIDLSNYNRTTKGWQGRLRMTGRNLLAKKVREQGGVVKMPDGFVPEHYQMDEDWLATAAVKYKPKDRS